MDRKDSATGGAASSAMASASGCGARLPAMESRAECRLVARLQVKVQGHIMTQVGEQRQLALLCSTRIVLAAAAHLAAGLATALELQRAAAAWLHDHTATCCVASCCNCGQKAAEVQDAGSREERGQPGRRLGTRYDSEQLHLAQQSANRQTRHSLRAWGVLPRCRHSGFQQSCSHCSSSSFPRRLRITCHAMLQTT